LIRLERPYLGFAYGAWMAMNTAYNAITNAYSLALELADENAIFKSTAAYRDITKIFSESPLQRIYDFDAASKSYEIQINNLLCERTKLEQKIQLEEEQGQFGKKLFDYIYNPMIEEQCSILNQITTGFITKEEAEAEALKDKHITIASEQQSYEHCIEAKASTSHDKNNNNPVDTSKQYYCFNVEEQILDLIIVNDNGSFEVLEQL
jgi:hypothetical protein